MKDHSTESNGSLFPAAVSNAETGLSGSPAESPATASPAMRGPFFSSRRFDRTASTESVAYAAIFTTLAVGGLAWVVLTVHEATIGLNLSASALGSTMIALLNALQGMA
jgi:hypothetical protein